LEPRAVFRPARRCRPSGTRPRFAGPQSQGDVDRPECVDLPDGAERAGRHRRRGSARIRRSRNGGRRRSLSGQADASTGTLVFRRLRLRSSSVGIVPSPGAAAIRPAGGGFHYSRGPAQSAHEPIEHRHAGTVVSPARTRGRSVPEGGTQVRQARGSRGRLNPGRLRRRTRPRNGPTSGVRRPGVYRRGLRRPGPAREDLATID